MFGGGGFWVDITDDGLVEPWCGPTCDVDEKMRVTFPRDEDGLGWLVGKEFTGGLGVVRKY